MEGFTPVISEGVAHLLSGCAQRLETVKHPVRG